MKECEVYPPKVGSGGGKLLPTLYGKHVMARHAVRVMLCALLPLGMAIVPFGPQISLAGAAEKKGDAKKKGQSNRGNEDKPGSHVPGGSPV